MYFNYPHFRLLVLARAPVPGTAKTRLIPALGADGAADLHALLVRDALERAAGRPLAPVELWAAPSPEHPFFRTWAGVYSAALYAQPPGDLGARMSGALSAALGRADAAVLIGTDTPGLDTTRLEEALKALDDGMEVVLGPAHDGGYALIGLRRPQPRLFDAIPWGGPHVLARTRERLRELGLAWHELEPVHDIDTPEDLRHLPPHLRAPVDASDPGP